MSEASSKVSSTLSSFSPNGKSSIIKRCVDVLSPASKSKVIQKISPAASSPLLDIYKSLSTNRDNMSNCARRLVLNKLAENKKVKQVHRGLNWSSLQKARTDVNKTLLHYKTERQKSKPRPEYVKKVSSFYNKDHISRTLPYKKLTKKIKDQNGNYERVAIRVMEITLRKAYQLFVQEHPEVKICRCQFETLRPKNICLKSNAKRLVCCCVYHTNIEYSRKPLNNLLVVSRKDTLLQNNDQLTSIILCDPNSFKCVFGLCSECKLFSNFDKLEIPSLKCSKSCFMKNEKCGEEGHTVKIQQFERVKYIHKGKEKDSTHW